MHVIAVIYLESFSALFNFWHSNFQSFYLSFPSCHFSWIDLRSIDCLVILFELLVSLWGTFWNRTSRIEKLRKRRSGRSAEGARPLTCLPHKLFCSFRLHSKVVELGYKIISQATCLSSLAVQLANWRGWFPVWVTLQNIAVRNLNDLRVHFGSFFNFLS